VEGLFCGHNIVARRSVFFHAVFPGHFDHRLVGLSSGILEKDLVHSGDFTYFFRQQRLWDRIRIIKGMHNVVHLFLHRGYDLFVAVSGAVYRDTSIEVQIGFPVFIVNVHIFRPFCDHREPLIGIDHIFFNKSFDVFFCISCLSQFHILLLRSSYRSPLICR